MKDEMYSRLLTKVAYLVSKVGFSQNISLGGPINRQIWGLSEADKGS